MSKSLLRTFAGVTLLILGLVSRPALAQYGWNYGYSMVGTPAYTDGFYVDIIESQIPYWVVDQVFTSLSDQELYDLYVTYHVKGGSRLDVECQSSCSAANYQRWVQLGTTGVITARVKAMVSPTPNLDYTISELYLDFRTAGFSVATSLGETAFFIATKASVWASAGYAIGTVVNYVLQRYYPAQYDALGGTLAGMMQQLANATDAATQGKIIKAIFALVGGQYSVSYTAPTGPVPYIGIYLGSFASASLGSVTIWLPQGTVIVSPVLIP